jgi:hypothetical protein
MLAAPDPLILSGRANGCKINPVGIRFAPLVAVQDQFAAIGWSGARLRRGES